MKAEETWAEQATYMYDFHIQELQETGSMWEKLLKKSSAKEKKRRL